MGRGAQRGREQDHKRLLLSGGAPAHPEPIVLERAPTPQEVSLGIQFVQGDESAHPTPAEYLEPLSFAEGVRRFSEQEAPAIRDLHDLLDQQPSAWCKPGRPSAARRRAPPSRSRFR